MKKIIIVNLALFLALLIVAEIVLRIKGVEFGYYPFEKHPIYHHTFPADNKFNVITPYGTSNATENEFDEHEVYFDSNRRYSSNSNQLVNKNSNYNVILLGDSYVVGKEVEYEKTFYAILQSKFNNINFENYAVTSYSPVIHYLLLINKIVALHQKPDLVMLFLYSNDVADDIKYLKSAKYSIDGSLIAIDGGKDSILISILRRRSYLYRWVRRTQATIFSPFKIDDGMKQDYWVVGGHAEYNSGFKDTPTEQYLLKIAHILKVNNIPFVLTVIPSKYCFTNNDYSVKGFDQKAMDWANENNISVLNLSSNFERFRQMSNQKLFFDKDIHFNETGHNFTAEILEEYFSNWVKIVDLYPN